MVSKCFASDSMSETDDSFAAFLVSGKDDNATTNQLIGWPGEENEKCMQWRRRDHRQTPDTRSPLFLWFLIDFQSVSIGSRQFHRVSLSNIISILTELGLYFYAIGTDGDLVGQERWSSMLLSFNVFGGGPSNTQVPVLPDQKKNKQKKTRKSGTNIEVDVVVAQSNTRSIIGRHSKRRTVLALGRSVRLIEFFFCCCCWFFWNDFFISVFFIRRESEENKTIIVVAVVNVPPLSL